MKNWENMVEYYRNNPEARKNILKHAGLLNEEPMKDKLLYNPDEFCLDNIKAYHYEEMSPEHKWMAFYFENGRIGHLNIFLKDGKLETRYEEWEADK